MKDFQVPFFLLFGLVSLSGVALGSAQKEDGWRPLFDGKTLDRDAWQQVGGGSFEFKDGVLRTVGDEAGLGLLLYTPETFGNCQIRVVFRTEDATDNAGVHVRIAADAEGRLKAKSDPETDSGAWWAVHHGYEIQIYDQADPLHRTGAVYSLAPAEPAPKHDPGAWRTMIITLEGDIVRVEVDGKLLTTLDPSSPNLPARKEWYEPKRDTVRPQSGLIGLQNHDPGDVVYFKEVSVRPLPAH